MTIEEITTYEKLADAFYSCKKPSWWKEQIQRYEVNLSLNLLELQREVREGLYRVGPTNNFTINERGKIRHIKAPNIKDRIVQKVLCKYILVPQLTKYLIKDCNACKSTIQSIDSLYNVLFPVKQKYNKFTRTQIIDRIYKDYFEPQFATLNY